MKPSEYDGKDVLHVDGGGLEHSGVVVGQSDDGETVFVKSRRNLPGAWDFAVAASLMPALIRNATLGEDDQ